MGSTAPGSSSSTPPRRLLDLPYRPNQLIASATNGRDAAGVISANVDRLQNRLPGRGDEPRGDRPTWLVGLARRHLPVIDNYERLAGSAPLTPLIPLLNHASDIALHLIVARQAGVARGRCSTPSTPH